jgi:hypothetical protein
MSAKHTPGPWVAFTADGHTNIIALTERTRVVFSLPGRDKNEPDVVLATAAPDLLAALEDMLREGGSSASKIAARRNARAAIAKARGGK